MDNATYITLQLGTSGWERANCLTRRTRVRLLSVSSPTRCCH